MNRNEPMSTERFRRLAEAYGGSILRWPEADRDKAEHLATDPHHAAILEEATELDDELDRWTQELPDDDLVARIVAAAPSVRHPSKTRRRLWWSGIGLAAALAGAATGGLTVATILSDDHATPEITTAFGNFSEPGL